MNNLQKIGLRNLDGLARVDAEARRRMYEQNQIESEAKNEAIGSLIGNVAGLGMAGYSEYKKSKPMDNPPGGEQAIGKASKEAVSPNKVLGENSVIAEKDNRTMGQRVDDYAGNGLGSATIRGAIDENAMPDILKDRPIVFAKSPTRSRLTSVWSDTTDEFKTAFNSLLSGFPSNIIG